MDELAGRFGLPAGAWAPAAARHAVASVLHGWGFRDPAWMRQTELVVSELVANAVIHAGGRLSIELHVAHGRVTIAALDASIGTPQCRDASGTGGPALRIIDALCTAWGVDHQADGRRVWVQLAPHPETTVAARAGDDAGGIGGPVSG